MNSLTVSHLRDVRDPRVLRAIAHPFRLTLLDLIERRGTLTSAQASALTGESTASCSFHLRQLAKYGFIERAEPADGRERPWKRATTGERVPDPRTPELGRAAMEVTKLLIDRLASESGVWVDRRTNLPPDWQDGVIAEELLYLTASELRELARASTKLLAEYRGRTAEPSSRPRDSRAVRAAAFAFPLPQDDDGTERQSERSGPAADGR